MSLAIIDCGSGNLKSAAKAFEKMSAGSLREIHVTKCPDLVSKSDQIVLPGVGSFPDFKKGLSSIPGLRESLEEQVMKRGKPFMGICVGMQLMADMGYEYSMTSGLGWLPGEVSKIDPNQKSSEVNLKVPHMGWNSLSFKDSTHPCLNGIEHGSYVYFVHSFHLRLKQETDLIATTQYGDMLTAIAGRDNIIGTQFHPEKSQEIGLRLIKNFLAWRP